MNAASYLLAACCALIPTRIEKFVAPWSTFLLIFFPFVNGALLVGMAISNFLYVNYICFILYHCVYEFMNPIASVQIGSTTSTISNP